MSSYCLMKSEPEEAFIDHLAAAPQQPLHWTGVVLQRGNRLSITPVSPAEWLALLKLLDNPAA